MEKNFLINLTNQVYHLTLLFPKKEPLRYKMRELADEILSALISTNLSLNNPLKKEAEIGSPLIFKDLEILDGFFEVARAQNWVSPPEILAVQKEYALLKEELEKIKTDRGIDRTKPLTDSQFSLQSSGQSSTIKPGLDSQPSRAPDHQVRQEKILEILKEKGRVQVWQIKEILPKISKRTLRRDFEQLLNIGIIERIGERNNTSYQLKKVGQ